MRYPALLLVILAATACQPAHEPQVANRDAETVEHTQNSAADAAAPKQKVVYHINYNNPRKQVGALHSIRNHLDAVGKENIDIRAVLHGSGLSLLLESDSLEDTQLIRANATPTIQARISQLKDDGVMFYICKNSLSSKQVDYLQDLYDVAKTDLVDNGISKIIELQSDGFMYLKP